MAVTKKKDVIYLSIVLAILLLIVFILLGRGGGGSKQAGGPRIEVVESVEPSYDKQGLTRLDDKSVSIDFSVKPDLTNLGNQNLFGQ